MRHGSPPNSKIAGDAKEAVDNCVAEFSPVLIRARGGVQAGQAHHRDRRRPHPRLEQPRVRRQRQVLALYLRRYREIEGTRPRARHTLMVALEHPTAPAVEAEVQSPAPPSPGLDLQLGPPQVRDVTELGPHADVCAVWRAADAAAAA
ncbi:uncharacterized protein LOC120702036 [Panicum virgatum]|uniref:Uncharacterized protein n=1 Tax=Panicum virgatum TaxID=38727 RepID=A0A8T0TRT0_PANVG|nr:uncharacterized protein LOC120702036 [Panicum virgatum]KAG2611755.1 hypothetical protein PVAP13_4KG139620 [Panicum virgatum]